MTIDETKLHSLLKTEGAGPAPGTSPTRYGAQTRLLDWARPLTPGALCLVGMPDDLGVRMNNGRPGAAAGPGALREALMRLGVAAPMHLDRPLPALHDAGDVRPADRLDETHARVSAVVGGVLERGGFPIGIGGGHDLTFAFARGHREAGRADVAHALYLDPHLDVRSEAGSGMPFRALVEHAGFTRLTCIGAEPLVNSREHFEWFIAHGGEAVSVSKALRRGSGLFTRPCHFSLDLDAIDASSAPGVSALNPAGVSVREAADLCAAAGRSPFVRSFDIMELSPAHDVGGRTARAAAYCLLSFIAGYAQRSKGESAC